MREINIGDICIGGGGPFVLIAGPCVIEPTGTLDIAKVLREVTSGLGLPFIFKCSFDKANRTSVDSYRGIGFSEGLEVLNSVKEELKIPTLTDIHSTSEVEAVSRVVDVLQIPALLCRQTDLLIAAGESGLPVNIKKGQFVAPADISKAAEKVRSTGNDNVFITERGTTFGYNNLVVDFRSLPIIRSAGYPVVFDATHSVQLPGGLGTVSGGDREMIPYMARAAAAVGIDGLFMEVHPDPDNALCDGPNSFPLDKLEVLLRELIDISNASSAKNA